MAEYPFCKRLKNFPCGHSPLAPKTCNQVVQKGVIIFTYVFPHDILTQQFIAGIVELAVLGAAGKRHSKLHVITGYQGEKGKTNRNCGERCFV
jgi:hypothetical protein